MLTGLQQKMSTYDAHYTAYQGEDYATIGVPDTTTFQQMT